MIRMPRVLIYDRLDSYLCDLDPKQVMELPYTEEVNGEHSLTIVTTQKLEKTNRVLVQDGTGEWHEYVVLGIDDRHLYSEYYCVWSLQYDLSGTFINGPYDCGVVPGHASIPQLPRRALEVSLGDTTRWEIGTITVTTMSSASFYRRSGWEGLQTVVERWGGEIHASIEVEGTGVVSRKVDLLEHEGTTEPTRRFDYGHDVTDIKRTVSDDIWPCRIVPLGKSQETEAGGYTRRPDIAKVNGGVMWLQDDAVAPLVRVRNPQGEWEYPTAIIRNDTYEQPADLIVWARENISQYTRPQVSYVASVAQLSAAGLNPHGVALGDEIIVVDRLFRDEGLRISARVLKIKGDLLDAAKTQLTIGNTVPTIGTQLGSITRQVYQMAEQTARTTDWEATAGYLANLLGRLNGEANRTGGYTYITQGEGLRTYDTPVSDPLVGAEASKVVEIKGGNIRIADSRTQAGDWDWKTVLVSGHIAAELVTAARLTAGYIGNASGSYWDLDNDILHIGTSAQVGDVTAGDLATKSDVEDAKKVATNYLDFEASTGLDVGYAGTQAKTRITGSGVEVFDNKGRSAISISSDTDGSTARIGDADAAHATVNYRSFNLIDADGKTYLDASDLRDASGYATVQQTFIGDGSTTQFITKLVYSAPPGKLPGEVTSCTVDGVALTYASGTGNHYGIVIGTDYSTLQIRTASAPAEGAVIVFTYTTKSTLAKAYTLGVRGDGIEGPMSLAEGGYCVASGYAAHAEGDGSAATTTGAHAEGHGSIASGEYSHAEGGYKDRSNEWHSTASGKASHAEGDGSTASGQGSHAEGRSTASGRHSHAEGMTTTASGHYSHSEGYNATASGLYSHAEGRGSEAAANQAHAEGYNTTASGSASHAGGMGTTAQGEAQTAIGKYNATHSTHLLIVGNGSSPSSRSNAMYLTNYGALWIASSLTQNSDRRLKEHHAYLGEDACDFVRSLRPALYTKDGQRHLGFYAQDVQEAEPDGWDTATVTAQHTDEGLGFDPLTLDYSALIAPLVAYAQRLEARIQQLEEAIDKKEEA